MEVRETRATGETRRAARFARGEREGGTDGEMMAYTRAVEYDAVRSAIPADESGEALLHAIQRVPEVSG